MVSIRKAKTPKQGFFVRTRNSIANRGSGLYTGRTLTEEQQRKETIGLLAAGICVSVLLMVLWMLISSGSGSGSNELSTDPASSSWQGRIPFRRKPHPQLVVEDDGDGDGDGDDDQAIIRKSLQNPEAQKNKKQEQQQQHIRHPKPVEVLNVIAQDILDTLNCAALMEDALKMLKQEQKQDFMEADDVFQRQRQHQRRLQEQHGDDGGFERKAHQDMPPPPPKDDDDKTDDNDPEAEKWGQAAQRQDGFDMGDDPVNPDNFDDLYPSSSVNWNAKHLFCLAAMEQAPPEIVDQFSCQATGRKRRTILDFWSSARAQISDPNLLVKILEWATEHPETQVLGKSYHFWAPDQDQGLEYMVNTLNNEMKETVISLKENLGPSKLFVDVGSGLGLTTLAILQEYPGTKVVSIEPASPNWLLQELNLRCHLRKADFLRTKVLLEGVGPNTEDEDFLLAKLLWRPTSTTSTRSWTPADEYNPDTDIELLVKLRKLRNILSEAGFPLSVEESTPTMMDVLNLDCQGCEYNCIPTLDEDEFDAIPNVMGNVHWGYIPVQKLPSSARGRETHERLCSHENIAKSTKECCGFMDVPVKSSIPGEVLYRDSEDQKRDERKIVTVSDIIPTALCEDFAQWSRDHYMDDIEDDYGWFEISSKAT